MSVRQGPWTVADVPDQGGRTAVVTGANSGIGFEAATVLAQRGAHTVLACRDTGKAEAAAARMTAAAPGASVSVVRLDLASLDSIRAAADQLLAAHERIDLLINNAGLMWPPYGKTADGFELQFGTNHLGHFAFTGLVLEAMLPVPGSRVVTVSSTPRSAACCALCRSLPAADSRAAHHAPARPGATGAPVRHPGRAGQHRARPGRRTSLPCAATPGRSPAHRGASAMLPSQFVIL